VGISVEKELETLRREIDSLDQEILTLLSKRLALVKKIGTIKHREGISVYQPERIKEVLATRCRNGEKLGLKKKFVRELYEFLIACSMEEEKKTDSGDG